MQLPTTLPTLDELIGVDGADEGNVARGAARAQRRRHDHVFTLHAELEGGTLAPRWSGCSTAGAHRVTISGPSVVFTKISVVRFFPSVN